MFINKFIVIVDILLLSILLFLMTGCCKPEKPVASIRPFHYNRNIVIKGYDCDCDRDIDYWQHYNQFGEIGSKIYTKGNEGKCE